MSKLLQNPLISSPDFTCPKLLTEQEVSALIRKSVHWLRRKRCSGDADSIPYRKLGFSVRYDEIEVIKWVEQHALQTSTSVRGGSCK